MADKHLNSEQHRGIIPADQLPTLSGDALGYAWKLPVVAASTTNGNISTAFENGDTIDGYVLATGDRILIKDQSNLTQNGIWVVNASGIPTRAADADTGAEMVAATVSVANGTVNAQTSWTCTTADPITVGSSDLSFEQLRTNNDAPHPTTTSVTADVPGTTVLSPPAFGTDAGESIRLQGNDAVGSGFGGDAGLKGGANPTDFFVGAQLNAQGATDTEDGRGQMLSAGTFGTTGQVIVNDVDNLAVWGDIDGGGP